MMPSEQEIERLLEKLCVEQGFCLSPIMNKRLIKFPPKTPIKFVDAVIKSEGLNPETIERSLHRDLLISVEAIFIKN